MPACDKGRFPATDVLRELREAGTSGPANSVFDRCVRIDWPALWRAVGTRDVHRAECDDREGILSVCADDQGDLHATMDPHPMASECGGGFGAPTFRARTLAGGGRCERIRAALALLALAIAEDQPNRGA